MDLGYSRLTPSSRAGCPSVVWMTSRNVCLQRLDWLQPELSSQPHNLLRHRPTISFQVFLLYEIPQYVQAMQYVEIFQLAYETRDQNMLAVGYAGVERKLTQTAFKF